MGRGDSYELQGQQGGVVIDSASGAVTGSFRWVLVANDAVLTSMTSNLANGATKLVGVTLPAGLGFGGVIGQIQVTSGIVIAYYG